MEFWQHQSEALAYMEGRSNATLIHGVGTGKTRTVLEFINRKQFHMTLIVGNQKGAVVWEKEVAKHGYDFNVLTLNEGVLKDRSHRMLKEYRNTHKYPMIVVINYEAFVRPVMITALGKIAFDLIVFDEVHKLRNHTTKQSKLAWKLATHNPKAYRIGLTGTPFYNKPLDAFGIMRFIDPKVFGTNWTAFKFRYAIWAGAYGQFPVQFINTQELSELVMGASHFVDRTKVLDLPNEQHIERKAAFDSARHKEYAALDKDFISLLQTKKIVATNILDKLSKLQQMTGGFIYNKGETVPFAATKATLLKELLEEIGEQDAVVFYKFEEEANIIVDACNSLGIKAYLVNGQSNQYEGWLNDPERSVLVTQIQSGSESLDFTKAAVTVFYSLISSYGQYEQALGRISRGNQQSKSVVYYYLVIEDTIDEKIMKALLDKKDLIDELLGR